MIDKSVIVTGASSGLGAHITRHLVSQGARVAAGARRVDRLQALAGELADAPGRLVVVEADVTRAEDAERLVAAAAEAFGGVDALVNNAGMEVPGAIEVLAEADLEADAAHQRDRPLPLHPGGAPLPEAAGRLGGEPRVHGRAPGPPQPLRLCGDQGGARGDVPRPGGGSRPPQHPGERGAAGHRALGVPRPHRGGGGPDAGRAGPPHPGAGQPSAKGWTSPPPSPS